jgi:hypothetical protein
MFFSLPGNPKNKVSETPTDTVAKITVFNNIRIRDYSGHVDIPIAAAEEQEMLKVVNDHRHVLNIGESQEMMVGITYVISFDSRQFEPGLNSFMFACTLMLLRISIRKDILW